MGEKRRVRKVVRRVGSRAQGQGGCGGEQDVGGDDMLVPCTAAGSWLTLRRTTPEEAGGPGGSSEEWLMQEGP